MRRSAIILCAILFTTSATKVGAMESIDPASPGDFSLAPDDLHPRESEIDPHPVLSANANWAGPLVICVVMFFIAAAVIGPIVRSEMFEDEESAKPH